MGQHSLLENKHQKGRYSEDVKSFAWHTYTWALEISTTCPTTRWAAPQQPSLFTSPRPSQQPICPSPVPSFPGGSGQLSAGRGFTLPPGSLVLPDTVGDPPHTDAVGGLCRSLRLAWLPSAVTPLQGGRPSARHPLAPEPHRSLPSRHQPDACHYHHVSAGMGAAPRS